VMADPVTDAFGGVVSVHRIQRPIGELGYWTHPAARGRGMTTEAVRMVSRHALIDIEDGGLGLLRLELFADVENTASLIVAERAGYTRIGTQRDGIATRTTTRHDCAIYDLLPTDLA
jgi:RimJ/RimL family protein N-acetyltransferase